MNRACSNTASESPAAGGGASGLIPVRSARRETARSARLQKLTASGFHSLLGMSGGSTDNAVEAVSPEIHATAMVTGSGDVANG